MKNTEIQRIQIYVSYIIKQAEKTKQLENTDTNSNSFWKTLKSLPDTVEKKKDSTDFPGKMAKSFQQIASNAR